MIQIDPMELDTFRLQDDYIGLQAPIFIEELVQPATIVRGVNVATIDVVANVLPNEGGGDDGTNVDRYATTFNSDN